MIKYIVILMSVLALQAHATQTRMADGCRNVVTGCLVTTGGGVGASYTSNLADPTGVNDSTAAFNDAFTVGMVGTSPNAQPPYPVYVPSGTYSVSGQIIFYVPGFIFGEPSSRPTIVLKSGSLTNSGSAIPFVKTLQSGRSVNNTFFGYFSNINLTVDSNNAGCSDILYWGMAQGNGIRDCNLTRNDSINHCLSVSGGGGGGVGNNITTSGGADAMAINNTSHWLVRGCTFNGPITGLAYGVGGSDGAWDLQCIACTFNNSGNDFGGINWTTASFDDCTFNCNFPGSTGSHADYHLERCSINGTSSTQDTTNGNTVYYNQSSVSGTSSSLNNIISTALLNPATPYPTSACVNILSYGGNGNGSTDNTSALSSAFAASNEVYFPPGTYYFSSTCTIPSGKKIWGAGHPYSVIAGQSNPVIKTTGNGSGTGVQINFLQLFNNTTANTGNLSVDDHTTLVSWNADPGSSSTVLSMMSSCWFRAEASYYATPSRLIIANGGVVLDELYASADSNADPTDQAPTAIQINSTGGVYGYTLMVEHYSGPGLVINGADKVYFRGVDTETGNSNWSQAQAYQVTNTNLFSSTCLVTSVIDCATLWQVQHSNVGIWMTNTKNSSDPTDGIVLEGTGTNYFGPTGNNQILDGYVDFSGIPSVPDTLTTITYQTPGAPGTLSTTKQ